MRVEMPCWWERSEENGQTGVHWVESYAESNNFFASMWTEEHLRMHNSTIAGSTPVGQEEESEAQEHLNWATGDRKNLIWSFFPDASLCSQCRMIYCWCNAFIWGNLSLKYSCTIQNPAYFIITTHHFPMATNYWGCLYIRHGLKHQHLLVTNQASVVSVSIKWKTKLQCK